MVRSIYDMIYLLGFLALVVLPAKNIFQRLYEEKFCRDEEIPQHLFHNWSAWLN